MKVQKVVMGNKSAFVLLDNQGTPLSEVSKFMKYLFNKESSSNTLRTYCTGLKHFYTFMNQNNLKFDSINISSLSNFVLWLRNPHANNNVIPQQKIKPFRSETTVNLYITTVVEFYRFLYRSQLIDSDVVDKLMKQVSNISSARRYKSFLHHITGTPLSKNILKLKVPKTKVGSFTKEQVQLIYQTATNIRDKLLILLLFETGLRIGEVLSLFIEDVIVDSIRRKHKLNLVDRGELPNGGKLKTGERVLDIRQELVDQFDEYFYEILDGLNLTHNFIFVKLRGQNRGNPMTYSDVYATFKEIERKLRFRITPHLFRHTHGTIYFLETQNLKLVQDRLGHSSIQTTSNMYIHLSPEDIRKEWEKASGVFDMNSE